MGVRTHTKAICKHTFTIHIYTYTDYTKHSQEKKCFNFKSKDILLFSSKTSKLSFFSFIKLRLYEFLMCKAELQRSETAGIGTANDSPKIFTSRRQCEKEGHSSPSS